MVKRLLAAIAVALALMAVAAANTGAQSIIPGFLNPTIDTLCLSASTFDQCLARSSNALQVKQYEPAPAAVTVALAGAGAGNVTNGTHVYAETCITAGGESTAGTSSSSVNVVDKTTNGQVTVTLKNCSPYATGRNVYRSKANTSTPLYLVATSPVVANGSSTTTYTDNIADASLTATTTPSANTAFDVHAVFVTDSGTGTASGLGIGTTTLNLMNNAGPNNFLTIYSLNARNTVELARGSDSDGATIGNVIGTNATQSTSDKRVAEIRFLESGITANNRGGEITLSTRADGGSTIGSSSIDIQPSGSVGIGLGVSGTTTAALTVSRGSLTNGITLSGTSDILRFSGSGGSISMSGGGSWVGSGDLSIGPSSGHVILGNTNDGIVYMPGPSPVTGTAGALYIGNNSPDTTGLNTNGIIHLQAANANSPQLVTSAYGTFPAFLQRRANGTFASPTALVTDDIFGGLAGRGWGTAFLTTSDAAINFKAAEGMDGTHHGSYITFETTPLASTTRAVVGLFTAGGQFIIGTGPTSGNIRLGLNGTSALQIAKGDGGSGLRIEFSGWLRNSSGASAGSSGGASSVDSGIRATTAIPDATLTTLGTVTIPNTAQAATIELTLHATMGAGGAVGENEASASAVYILSVTRTAGVNAVGTLSTAYGVAASSVAGAGTITAALTLAAVSGAVNAQNTIAVQVTITRSGAGATNHKAWLTMRVINSNAAGITMAT